jgi:hypothetical protein
MNIRVSYSGYLIVILLFLAVQLPSLAQKRTEDVVRLKNGSIIRGKILNTQADTVVRVETEGRNVWVFSVADVRNITEEPIPRAEFSQKGYVFALEMGVLSGRTRQTTWGWGWPNTQSVPVNNFTFQVINGYQFNQYLALGAGLGIDAYNGAAITPLYLRVNGDVLPHRITPVYLLDAGYGFYSSVFNAETTNNQSRYRGGIMLNPAIGVRVHAGKHSSFLMSLGYRLQKYYVTTPVGGTPGDRTEDTHTLNRLSIRAGFTF